jgi:hypothetical protein
MYTYRFIVITVRKLEFISSYEKARFWKYNPFYFSRFFLGLYNNVITKDVGIAVNVTIGDGKLLSINSSGNLQ